jgi:cyanophycin synthetase
MHLKPGVGKPRPVGRAIVDNLFPKNESGRIPVIGVTGSFGKTTVAKHPRATCCRPVTGSMSACLQRRLFLGRRHVQKTDAANWTLRPPPAAQPRRRRGGDRERRRTILGEGLPYDRCQSASSPTSIRDPKP